MEPVRAAPVVYAHRAFASRFAVPAMGAGEIHAENRELVADRPGFREPATVVGPGVLQTESGVILERLSYQRASVLTVPATTLRYGFARRWELRLSSDSLVNQTGPEAAHGIADLQIGAKWRILEEQEWLPSLAFLPGVSVPPGSSTVTSGSFDPIARFSFARALP